MKAISLFLAFLFCTACASQQSKMATVAFYNVENLFDTEDDPHTFDDDYTPSGTQHWTSSLLNQKIDHLAEVIVDLGSRFGDTPPLLIGLAEVENRFVLQQFISHPKLQKYGYDIIHYDSPDGRGIDVALLYRKDLFLIENTKKYKLFLTDPQSQRRSTTRDQLVVTGTWDEIEIAVLVNHWPSRRGGQKRSESARLKASQLQMKILDSLQRNNQERLLISMGDFNDNPNNKSIQQLTKSNDYYPGFQPLKNPMLKLYKKGIGSLAHRDRWHLFDQILLSEQWFSEQGAYFIKAGVYSPPFLRNPNGKFKGYPYRNQIEGNQLQGYSDHFPVYVVLGKNP